MKRAIILILCFLALTQSVSGQQTDQRARNWLTVVVDSVFIRELPTQESDFVASRFESDRLEAVGRNADGTWFQVVRPYSETVIGWISRATVIYDFEITLLPITDLTTGVTGGTPIVDSGISVFIVQNARLRSDPFREGDILAIMPNSVTVPALARSQAGDWIQVNYNGVVGWVAEFLTRTVNDVAALPVYVSNRPVAPVTVIPPEVQIAQINRLRAFLAIPLDTSNELYSRISAITTGEIVPCTPINEVYATYSYTAQDVRELPELGRYGPTINAEIEALNDAIVMVGGCGVYTEAELVNATGLLPGPFFNSLLHTLDNLEEYILSLG